MYIEFDTVSSSWPNFYELQGCAARNVHGFTQDDIQKMACQWEEASSMYLKLDAKVRLFFVYTLEMRKVGVLKVEVKDKPASNLHIFLHEYIK